MRTVAPIGLALTEPLQPAIANKLRLIKMMPQALLRIT